MVGRATRCGIAGLKLVAIAMFISACAPIIYQSVSQTEDGRVTISGNQGTEAVILECDRTGDELDCTKRKPGDAISVF